MRWDVVVAVVLALTVGLACSYVPYRLGRADDDDHGEEVGA